MAVNGVSNSTSSIYGNRNVFSGLASGLDTESMIENMLSANRARVDAQKQRQQSLLWQQEYYQSVSTKLINLSRKYTSYTSPATNLLSESFFSPSIVTPQGANASKVSASGNSTSKIEVAGVTQLAQNESITFSQLAGAKNNPTSIEASEALDLTSGEVDVSKIANQFMTFKYQGSSFSISMSADREYTSAEDIAAEMNAQLERQSVSTTNGGSIKMSDKIEVEAKDNQLTIKVKDNSIQLTSSENDFTKLLGISKDSPIIGQKEIKLDPKNFNTQKPAVDVIAGSEFSFSYNGVKKTIRIPGKDSADYTSILTETSKSVVEKNKTGGTPTGTGANDKDTIDANKLKDYIQGKINEAFGNGRVSVENKGNDKTKLKLEFKLADSTDPSTISLDGGSLGLVGKSGAFKIATGATNRTNINATLGDLMTGTNNVSEDKQAFIINGVTIGEYNKDSKLSDIINDINKNEQVGVKASYSKVTGQFTFTATAGGAGGRVEMKEKPDGNTDNLAVKLFGKVEYNGTNKDGKAPEATPTNGGTRTQGQDAKMIVKVDGTVKEITSATNTFAVDGMSITANETFGAKKVDEVATLSASELVTFNSKVDTDKIVDTLKAFATDYNAMLEEVNSLYTTMPDTKKTYKPLTDTEKEDMSDKQIEEYDKKAKQGLLFNSQELGGLRNGLSYLFNTSAMKEIGITVSTDRASLGQISIDENKLRDALNGDPDKVKNAFQGTQETATLTGKTTQSVVTRLKEQFDKYAGTTGAVKGILIQKAGSPLVPTSLLQNSIQTQLDDVSKMIDKLNDKINDQIDTYSRQFSRLEVLMNQFNSQSSYFSGMMGGY